MKLKATVITALRKLDRFSPYPLIYQIIMSDKEKALFDKAVKESRYYLEFGLGGSTIRALQKSKAMITTVESCPEWINVMRKYLIIRYFEKKRLHIFPVDIGPVRDWGYPEPGNDQNLFERYSSNIFNSIDRKSIDLALVDSRFRVACTLNIILLCHQNKHLKILIHDFWNRPHYHAVLKYLDTVSRVDTMGLFSIKKDVDLKSAKNAYETYKFISE